MNEPDLNGDAPILMGIVNVTPDSFSDGGLYLDTKKAIEHGLRLVEEGAHILDIGGESTRPGAAPVSVAEEQARILPVIHGLKQSGAFISVDTRHAATMRAALNAGVGMINDVTALTHDPDSLGLVASSGVLVCLMHMKGQPQTMQAAPFYDDIFQDVFDYLQGRIEACLSAGMARNRIVVDPGIGFGKNLEHNLTLLNRLADFRSLNVPLLLGASRKRFIEMILSDASADRRLPGSLAAVLAAYQQGVRAFRVHDVAETVQALAVFRKILDK